MVLFGPDQQVFLINAADPGGNGEPWWEIPGGGIEFGESSAHCAARELHEEGGFAEVEVGPVVATQHVQFTFAGMFFDQDEVIHVARTEQADIVAPQGLEFFEALAFRGSRWWTMDEILESKEQFLPPRFQELIAVLKNGLPAEPVDITPHPEG
ncbi:MAG: 8-oxo-dGTP pyrophosphatase MutT (NUDIX family) [Acidimicrobiales bacterium]